MMLFVSLFFSGILLVTANRVYSGTRHSLWIVFALLGLGVLPIVLTCILPPVLMLGFVLIPLMVVGKLCGWQAPTFRLLSCGTCALVFGLFAWFAFQGYREIVAKAPFESIEDRLANSRSPLPAGTLNAAAQDRLTKLENSLDQPPELRNGYRGRTAAIRHLHENAVAHFIDQPGFGSMRRARENFVRSLQIRERPQPGERCAPPGASAGEETTTPLASDAGLDNILSRHKDNVVDFAYPEDYGYIKDRQHVAGFRAHHFREYPKDPDSLSIQTLDLVGLIMHEEPVVYVSENLPKMDELAAIPTRPLNDFESEGLALLRKGEDLAVREVRSRVYVLGAIRSARQCMTCHGGQRGDLLGAFSYTLKRPEK